jgi:hypothetical protein
MGTARTNEGQLGTNAMGTASTSIWMRHPFAIAALLLSYFLLAIRHLGSPATYASLSPTTADFSLLGPLGELLDVSRAPLLWPFAALGGQSSAHAREGDFSGFLYAEDGALFVLDVAGPVCLGRAFFVLTPITGRRPLPWGGEMHADAITYDDLSLIVEVDGALALHETHEALFGWGTNFSLWPTQLRPSLPNGMSGGFSLHAPLCAAERLRVAWEFAGYDGLTGGQLLLAADHCIEQNSLCPLLFYFDTSFTRLSAPLPRGWLSSANALRAPQMSARGLFQAGITGSVEDVISGPRLLAAVSRRAEPSATAAVCVSLSQAQPSSVVFSRSGAGVVLALELAFANLTLARSRRLEVRALWDGGAGQLVFDMEALFGPAQLPLEGDGGPSGIFQTLPSAQLWLGLVQRPSPPERASLAPAKEDETVAFIALPAPFWESARIELRLLEGGAPLDVCATVRAAGAEGGGPLHGWRDGIAASSGSGGDSESTYSRGTSGYLQGMVHENELKKLGNVALFDVMGVMGKVVVLTDHLALSNGEFPFCALEGDIRVFVDNCSSPSTWDSGYEDFFNGAHGYDYGMRRTEQAFFQHQLKHTFRGSGQFPNLDLLSVRLFGLDAPTFLHSLRIEMEGFPGPWENAKSRGAVLYYGTSVPPPRVTDAVSPAAEWLSGGGGHNYKLHGPPPIVYNLSSAFAGRGEPVDPDGICPPRPFNILSGNVFVSCTALRFSLQALALPAGTSATFSVKVEPGAARVALRRTFDARYSVQRAELRVGGARVGVVQSSGRAWQHLDTNWRQEDVLLPPLLTRQKSWLDVEVKALGDGGAAGRTYPAAQLGEAWTEAGWKVICYFL